MAQSLTGFLISVGLALGVSDGIQKLGNLGLFPFTPAPSSRLSPVAPPAPEEEGGAEEEEEEGGIWTVPGSMPAMLLILGTVL